MIIGIIDYPGRNHKVLTEELIKNGVIVLDGEYERLINLSKTILQKHPETIIAWDNPSILEYGYENYLDKCLVVSRFRKSLSQKEKEISDNRDRYSIIEYDIAVPEIEREKTTEKMNATLQWLKKDIKEYVCQWNDEIINHNFITDDEFFNVSAKMIPKETKINVRIESTFSLPYVARYVKSTNTIVINTALLRYNKTTLVDFRIIVAHELGHAVDPQLDELHIKEKSIKEKLNNCDVEGEIINLMKQLKDIRLTLENNAFDYSYDFIPSEVSVCEVEKHRKKVLNGYVNLLKQEQDNYIKAIISES